MAALDRALALAEVNRRAVRVGENLELDVPRVAQVAFEQHGVVAEGRERLALGGVERLVELSRNSTTRMPRPPPPALALISSGKPIVSASARSVAGDDRRRRSREPSARRRVRTRRLASILLPIAAIASGERSDEDDARVANGARELRPLGEKAVARMHRVGLHCDGRRENRSAFEIRLRRGRRTDATSVVDELQMVRACVGFRIHAERNDAHLARGARDAHRDLAAIGDQ